MIDRNIPAIALSAIGKSFGPVNALEGVDLTVYPGRVVAIMGHNGAGKSTLTNIIGGWLRPSTGSLSFFGQPSGSANTSARLARADVKVVFQELSLCPNLTAFENMRLAMPGLFRPGWRRRSKELIASELDRIFPGHGIDVSTRVCDLSIAKRQMVEIARAFASEGPPPKIVILDEPTSSLGAEPAAQLLAHMRRVARLGTTVFFISHRMDEILEHTDEIVVMRDGTVVAHRPSREFTHDTLVAQMGMVHAETAPLADEGPQSDADVVVDLRGLTVRKGSIVGLAGLDGHGQKQLLDDIYRASRHTGGDAVTASMAFVAGDRQNEGIFPLWSIARNISAGRASGKRGRQSVPLSAELDIAATWRERLSIRAPDVGTPITSLSGGNQQKVLIARAFAHQAEVILLDDPMRGVDVGTKREMYAFIREQAVSGKTFVWYSTEIAELENCDVVYVFYRNEISAVLRRSEVSEQSVLEASFGKIPQTRGSK